MSTPDTGFITRRLAQLAAQGRAEVLLAYHRVLHQLQGEDRAEFQRLIDELL